MMHRRFGVIGVAGLLLWSALGCSREVPATPAPETLLEEDASIGEFDVAPDGRLALPITVRGKSAIFVADADGRRSRRITFGVWDASPAWSPDGRWIAFRRDIGQQNDLIIVPADSGPERVAAATTANESIRGWVDGGKALLFLRAGDHGLEPWTYRLADGVSARLFERDGILDACTSRVGESVVYTRTASGGSTVWRFVLATQEHQQLTTEGFERVRRHCASHDGRSIVFESSRTGTVDLWRLEIADGTRRQLTTDVADDTFGRFSPDGSEVVFLSSRGGQQDLWVVAEGEADVRRVTDDAFEESRASWAADGRSLLAQVARGHQHLYRVPLDGAAATPLTSGPWDVGRFDVIGGVVMPVELSRDRSRLAYSGSRNGDPDIWIVPTTGGSPWLASGAPGPDVEPALSPDGSHVVFTSMRSGNRDLWIAPADAGSTEPPRQLTSWPGDDGYPRWSPDGRSIAFLSSRESGGRDLWVVPASGGSPRRLTTLGSLTPLGIRWHPDSRSIAFSAQSGADGGEVVFSVPAAGGAPRVLAPPTSRFADWSPDGRRFGSYLCRDGYCSLEIRSADGALLHRLSTGAEVFEVGLRWSRDGKQVMVSSQDLESLAENRVDVRADTARGPGRFLTGVPAGMRVPSVLPLGFGPGDSSAIVLAGPGATALQRFPAPRRPRP
ncbi:MAG: hypothetical protein NW201_06740 [Gemmatimonadales bacterium]|nr:hypothetical protein [Gemmatimonadales bacterium]